ncbi:hypothetical protein ACWGH2_15175 [Streptomyces sp. NPDC054871]
MYDLRTGNRFTLKQSPLMRGYLEDFEKRVFGVGECKTIAEAGRQPAGRLQVFDGAKLAATKDVNLDNDKAHAAAAADPDLRLIDLATLYGQA